MAISGKNAFEIFFLPLKKGCLWQKAQRRYPSLKVKYHQSNSKIVDRTTTLSSLQNIKKS
jgi:hypothetical protein